MSSRGTDDLDDVLRRVCEPDGIRDITAAPFLIDVDGSPWRVATDGARMLLLSGHGGVAREHPAGGQGEDKLRRVIAYAPDRRLPDDYTYDFGRGWQDAQADAYLLESAEG